MKKKQQIKLHSEALEAAGFSKLENAVTIGEVFRRHLEGNLLKGEVEVSILALLADAGIKTHAHPSGRELPVQDPATTGISEGYYPLSDNVKINGKDVDKFAEDYCGLDQKHGIDVGNDIRFMLTRKIPVNKIGYLDEKIDKQGVNHQGAQDAIRDFMLALDDKQNDKGGNTK